MSRSRIAYKQIPKKHLDPHNQKNTAANQL